MTKNEEKVLSREIDEFRGVSVKLADSVKIGEAISALSNEVNLSNDDFGLVIISSKVEKSQFKEFSKYVEIKEVSTDDLKYRDSVILKISAAPRGIPVECEGFFFGLNGEEVVPLSLAKLEKIRNEKTNEDWSAQICKNATIDDLDQIALKKAREGFKIKFQHLSKEIDSWDDIKLLNKSRLAIRGALTNASILLLGKEDSEHLLSQGAGQITWIVKDDKNTERGYQHFGLPVISQIEPILGKIRNLKYDYSTDTSFAPVETTKYQETDLRELLLNAIAHQNYKLGGKITIIEKPEDLTISNLGEMFETNLNNVLFEDAPGLHYRNQHLVNIMVNLNLIDAIGSGIKKIYMSQRYKNFPMPDVDQTTPNHFKVKIYGKVINKNYTEKLIARKDLDLDTIILLDKVQKKIIVSEEEYRLLRDQKLVNGRYPDITVASKFSASVGEKPQFVEKKVYSTDELKQLVINLMEKKSEVSRQEIDSLLLDKYPKELEEKKRRTKIKNLLFTMSKKDITITNKGSATKPVWCLLK
ncbi:MAG: hypothetical protein JEY94_03855 [Melioribacteraceae bacterium]|nr:hypothetical protein [Melioribacteraceae bacterium]